MNKSPYNLKKAFYLIQHGLFLQGVRHIFAKAGINIMPYYWVEEEYYPAEKPKLKSLEDHFEFIRLKKSDVDAIKAKSDSVSAQKITKSVEDGHEFVGLKQQEEVVAYMFIKTNDFIFQNREFKFNPNEAYILNVYTFPEYRGRNLAPYLCYLCYRYLDGKGIDTKYSISNYFNTSAIKYKEKLNARPLQLMIYIELFKTFNWHFVLRSYKYDMIPENTTMHL